MRLYTRHGDSGETGLWAGRRVSKDHTRIELLGAVDECNAMIGLALAQAPADPIPGILSEVQHDLFVVGCEVMAPDSSGGGGSLPRLQDERCRALERTIDDIDARLPPLKNFIVPGGGLAAAHIHAARAVCRRAERRAVALDREEPNSRNVLVYLNRLSDLLFVLARYDNHALGTDETTWAGQKTTP